MISSEHIFSETGRESLFRVLLTILGRLALVMLVLRPVPLVAARLTDLGNLKPDQKIAEFRVANLYSDDDKGIVGAKFVHQPSGAPVFILQIETVPQAFMWVDTPADSDRGLPHALEHLLAEKGTKGRYAFLLSDMGLSQSAAATWRDFNFFSFASGSGMDGFFVLFHAWLDALYYPDFTDAEAEREFYHFSVAPGPDPKIKTLTEGGSVYNEEMADQGEENCFRDLKSHVLGRTNPLAARIGGDPDQMRAVTPRDIREFHGAHYRLGPTTGFIFVIHPKEDVRGFLLKVSGVFAPLVKDRIGHTVPQGSPGNPKYAVAPGEQNVPEICPVPAANEADPSQLWFAWKSQKLASVRDLKLLNLFFQGLADGPRSLLYKSLVDSKTRESDTGLTNVTLDPAPSDSPQFLLWNVALSGVSGNQISIQKISQLQDAITSKIRDVSTYPDGSEGLTGFNRLISSYAQDKRRQKKVFVRNSPLFGGSVDTDWKEFLEYLEMDSSFVRSLSEDALWMQIESELNSGKNLWRDLIKKYHLQDAPYSVATQPSPHLLHQMEVEKLQRLTDKIKSLRDFYQVASDQEALGRFAQDESVKTKEIEQIESKVRRPHFTEHPPSTLDDDIRFSELQIQGVPVIATLFERPATLEIGLSFDLQQIPRRYYKYLPILASCFDSTGLKQGSEVTPYPEMLAQTRSRFVEFGAGLADSGLSRRADFTFKASATSVPEFREALDWMWKALLLSNIDVGNVTRLRDIVAQRIAVDDSYTKQAELSWVFTPAQAFRYQDDTLYLALESQFTKAHWDGRLRWLLHEPASAEAIDHLSGFATKTLSGAVGASREDVTQRLSKTEATGLEAELVDYWRRNLNSFPENKLVDGLGTLALEVEEDLRSAPVGTIQELQELRRLVVNRRLLRLDLLVSPSALAALQPDLARFIGSIPDHPLSPTKTEPSATAASVHPIIDSLIRQNGLNGVQTPWYLGLVIPDEQTGNAIFYSDFVNYSQTDQNSLVRLLSSEVLSGRGPNSVYMKSREAGLAYALFLRGDPGRGLMLYYADRSLDIPSLISSVNSAVREIPTTKDPYLVDYVLRQAYPMFSRSSFPFSLREQLLTQDIRDGNTPNKVRRFYEALLKLREDPDLSLQLVRGAKDALCGILVDKECKEQQQTNHSIFFFVASEKILADTEKRLQIPNLVRVWPSNYWLP